MDPMTDHESIAIEDRPRLHEVRSAADSDFIVGTQLGRWSTTTSSSLAEVVGSQCRRRVGGWVWLVRILTDQLGEAEM